ncbi:VOC family protein [Pseudonocardia zijingensis]
MVDMTNAFHAGFVVPDLVSTIDSYRAVLSTDWTPIQTTDLALRGPDGPFSVTMRMAFSTDGPVRIELIEPIDGTPWEQPCHPALGAMSVHHIAFWCDDLAEASTQMAELGARLLVTLDNGQDDGVSGFTYHRMPDGAIVELVDSRSRRAFERWFAGGPFPAQRR